MRVLAVSRLGCSGDMDPGPGVIRVKFAEATYMEETLLHEITHAVWGNSGLGVMLIRKWGHLLTESQLADLEEDIITLQTPGLIATLKQAGWLTMPSPPSKE